MSSQDVSPDSPSGRNSKDMMFEPKPKPKMIRVLTVLAYVLSVSMAAILLSIYYIFMWDGRPHIGARRSNDVEMMKPHNYSYRNISKPEYSGGSNMTRDVALADSLRIINETKDYEEELNITTKQDSMSGSYETQDKQAIMLSLYYVFLWNGDQKITAKYVTSQPKQQRQYLSNKCNSILAELQQQITAIESEEITASSTIPTTSEESVTWPDDYEFERSAGIFLKKMVGRYDY